MKLEFFSYKLSKIILKYQISQKFFQWEPSCSVRADGNVTKPVVAFRNFANAPQAEQYCAHRAQQFKDCNFRRAIFVVCQTVSCLRCGP